MGEVTLEEGSYFLVLRGEVRKKPMLADRHGKNLETTHNS